MNIEDYSRPWQEVWPEHATKTGQMKRTLAQEVSTMIYIYRAKNKHGGDTYDYSQTRYTKSFEKVSIGCKEHGFFMQEANSHLMGKGCGKCFGTADWDVNRFILEANKAHGEGTYDYSKVVYTKSSEKVTIICKSHGEFQQEANSHIQGHGCWSCRNETIKSKLSKPQEEFIRQAKEKHPELDFSKVKYVNSSTPVIVICSKHGETLKTPTNLLQGGGCLKCSGKYQWTTKEILEKIKKVHGETYNYSKFEYTKTHNKSIVTCKIHGDFLIRPYTHIRGVGCLECSPRRSSDTLYLLKYPEDGVYKIGISCDVDHRVTKLSKDTEGRIEIVDSWDLGPVEARRVETLLLNTFTNKPVLCREFDGHTELRLLTVDDVINIRSYLQELIDESI